MSFSRRPRTTGAGGLTARAARALAAAVLAPSLLAAAVTAGAGTAAAAGAEPSREGGATATLDGLKTYGQAVVREDGEDQRTGAGLFEMAVDGGGTLQTYGIDIDNPTQQQARYEETAWRATSLHDNRDAGKIRWILAHSYPQVNDLAALAKSAGAGRLSPETAAAGTQVAIWRYSDGADVHAVDPAAEKLAGHLQRAARKLAEPRASLALEPASVAGRSGGLLGPVTVRTGAASVGVAPAPDAASQGVRVVSEHGRPVTSARDGARLFFDVPDRGEPATTSLTVQAATKIPVGRALTGVGGSAKSQPQILAGSSRSTVSATATAGWAEDGAIPAVSARKNCAEGGLDVTVVNAGDRPFRFRLADRDREVAAGSTRTVTVPVQEDQPYRVPVTATEDTAGAAGAGETFTGGLDCATARETGGRAAEPDVTSRAAPATVGGGEAREDAADGGDLAETGSGDTSLIVGLALGLVFLGAVAVYTLRGHRPDGGAR